LSSSSVSVSVATSRRTAKRATRLFLLLAAALTESDHPTTKRTFQFHGDD
jgi:hypothetical protein